jgi:predicted CoA-binding protein
VHPLDAEAGAMLLDRKKNVDLLVIKNEYIHVVPYAPTTNNERFLETAQLISLSSISKHISMIFISVFHSKFNLHQNV